MSKRLAWLEFGLGVRDQLPLQLGVVPFGVVFGVIGTSAGLSPLEAVLMSSLVFGGASQIVFVQLWAAGAPPDNCGRVRCHRECKTFAVQRGHGASLGIKTAELAYGLGLPADGRGFYRF